MYAVVQMGGDTDDFGVMGYGETRSRALNDAEARHGLVGLINPVPCHHAEDGDIVIVNWDIIIALRGAESDPEPMMSIEHYLAPVRSE